MADCLNESQVLLLDNLMYLSPDEGPFTSVTDSTNNSSVGDYARQQLENISNMPARERTEQIDRFEAILKNVANDPDLSNMTIKSTKVESAENGSGGSALFVNESTKEAVVAYRGTASAEWKDNFTGGGPTDQPDGVSTLQQEAALNTYQEYHDMVGEDYMMTVTGHSKGGNKAKYITVLDDSVDRCLSYDGQGFSDEFMHKYGDEIARNQSKIENHNVDDDFVNLLLNDIGETHFYDNAKGGDLASNHYYDAFFKIGEDGSMTMVPRERSRETAELDKFLNSMLRSMDPKMKEQTLDLIGDLVSDGFNGEFDIRKLINKLESGSNIDNASYLLAYLIEYEQANPGFAKDLENYLSRNGLENVVGIIDTVQTILNDDFFDLYYDIIITVLDKGWDILPNFLKEKILDWLEGIIGVDLNEKDALGILEILENINGYMNTIDGDNLPSGEDIAIQSRNDRIYVDTDYLAELASKLSLLSNHLDDLAARATAIANDSATNDIGIHIPIVVKLMSPALFALSFSDDTLLRIVLNRISKQIDGCREVAKKSSTAIQKALERYEQAENTISGFMQF